jgi:hypothetical protein
VSPADAAILATKPDIAYVGSIPIYADMWTLPKAQRLAWGRELGRRFRDAMRNAERQGHPVDGWQLDEIWNSAGNLKPGTQGVPMRQFMRATLFGLHAGRPELGDAPLQGFAYFAYGAKPLMGAPIDPELDAFWTVVEHSCSYIIGEEYPAFSGDPKARAQSDSAWQQALKTQTDVRAKLANRYIAGLTPGLRNAPGLGGAPGAPMATVDSWRDAYILERSNEGIAGLGEFCWVKENSDPHVMTAALDSILRALPNIR